MNPAVKEKWLQQLAVRRQTKHCLHNTANDSYCCLGVLVACYLEETGKSWDSLTDTLDGMWGWEEVLPHEVKEWAELDDNDPALTVDDNGVPILHCMTHLNDEAKYTFEQLAALIKEQF